MKIIFEFLYHLFVSIVFTFSIYQFGNIVDPRLGVAMVILVILAAVEFLLPESFRFKDHKSIARIEKYLNVCALIGFLWWISGIIVNYIDLP